MDTYDLPSAASPPDTDERPIYYYLKNQKNKKVVTICLTKYKEWFSRGIALCSPVDQFEKGEGRWWANKRAYIGTKILMNSEKPLTEKQIRRGRIKVRFVALDKIKRKNAIEVALSLAYIDPETGETKTQDLPAMYKISTCEKSGLTDFEKRLIDKIKR